MDYKSLRPTLQKYTHSIFDTNTYFRYGILGTNNYGDYNNHSTSGAFAPVSNITKAMTLIDEESFESILPKLKSGPYKMADSLVF